MADLTVSSDIDTFMASANFAAARTNLGLELGSDIQAYDSQLEDIAGLATTDGGFIVGNGSTFVLESGATARTSLGLGSIAVLSAPSGTVVGTSDTQTLTNKTIDGDNNTLSNLDIGNEVDWAAAADVADRSAAPASGDKLLLFEAGVGLRKIDWDDLPSGGGGGGSFSLPYSDGDSVTGSDATTTFELTPTWNTTGAPTVIGVDVTDTASDAASLLMDLQVGGTSKFSVAKDGQVNIFGSTGTHIAQRAYVGQPIQNSLSIKAPVYVGVDTGNFAIFQFTVRKGIWARNSGIRLLSGHYYGFSSSATDAGVPPDTRLYRDAAQTLAQRNGTNAQTFNIYNTYTDASNYERGYLSWSDTTNIFAIGTEAAGTGTGYNIYVKPQGQLALIIASNAIRSYKPITASSDGNVDLGAASKCWRDIYLKPSSSLTPANNGDLCIEATNNTTLTFKLKGSDGTVRSGTVTLA